MARPHIIIPGTGTELLRRELALAFAAEGCGVTEVHPASLHDPLRPAYLAELSDGSPALLFSVNFQGLYPLAPVLELLRKTGGCVAVWCVDNPWNLLSGVRDPRWKTLSLFVSDASFIKPLREHGAKRVFHLPLAMSPLLFRPDPAREARFPAPDDCAPFVFVGRSAFPGKERFFSGEALPAVLMDEARSLLLAGGRPDLLWWERALGSAPKSFWPGKLARRPAFGAEENNLLWRGLCLRAAACAGRAGRDQDGADIPGVDIFGDEGWQHFLPPQARLRPPVDYYARLPGIYAKASFSLCLTSLQLPQGLNQRHFDIWMAGGLCLSDATPGLALFPEELTRPIIFQADSIARVAERADAQRTALIADWKSHLLERHTYAHRARFVLESLGFA